MLLIAAGHVVVGLAVFLFAVHYVRLRWRHTRLTFAALAVINDHRERLRLYPAWYRQPHLLKVMNDLDRSIAVKDFRNRVRAHAAINELVDAVK